MMNNYKSFVILCVIPVWVSSCRMFQTEYPSKRQVIKETVEYWDENFLKLTVYNEGVDTVKIPMFNLKYYECEWYNIKINGDSLLIEMVNAVTWINRKLTHGSLSKVKASISITYAELLPHSKLKDMYIPVCKQLESLDNVEFILLLYDSKRMVLKKVNDSDYLLVSLNMVDKEGNIGDVPDE